ncbi:PE family protein (plasmid) [Mycolicibacterium psychrotolerans]|uniref:PE family protein n=1 Tax=Mycolicibacterium psychrotolerans TaxID=216929 RepID=UPI003D678B92
MFVSTEPAAMAAAASGLMGIGTTVTAGNAAAAAPTTGVIPPGLEETSAMMAAAFGTHGALYQAVSAMATAFHQMMVANLTANAGTYEAVDAAGAIAAL